MRTVPASITAGWLSEDKTGPRRPVVRATVERTYLRRVDYDTALAPGGDFTTDRHRVGHFTTIVMGDPVGGMEIRNIKEYSWTRSVNHDVAECTIKLKNTDLTPIGNQEEVQHADDFDQPGLFSPMRGGGPFGTHDANPWGYDVEVGWTGRIVPDRLVKTYEGYGSNPAVLPSGDENLVQSGIWLIDTATYDSNGDIELKMRDVGRLLFDRIVFPPVVPYEEYPLSWTKIHTQNVDGRDVTGGSWVALTGKDGTATSSNSKYIGKGITDPGQGAYVTSNGGVQGHHPAHVLENKTGAYWWSTGQTTSNSKVWWEIALNDKTTAMNGLRITPKGGPYRLYVSLEGKNGWLGRKNIPYDVTTEGVDVKAGIPFVYSTIADKNLTFDVILKKVHGDIKRIRLTFTRLMDTQVGNYPFRAGLHDLKIYRAAKKSALGFKNGKFLKTVGNYRDYTDIVKWACAWGGFFWPPHSTDLDFMMVNGARKYLTYSSPDTVLPKGRVWGDFMNSGTAGEAPLTVDLFDKQPLFSIISYVRDILGYVFFIDELGAVVFRMPNLWKKGNYLSPGLIGQRTAPRTNSILTLRESDVLLSYSYTLDSKNLRERIFVGNSTGKFGTVIKGYNPYPQGFGRVAGWTDQNFATKKECRVTADMIAARQMFDYRRSRITIAGNPAIQIDDQIRVFERVTAETYYQYVETITSTLNMENGQWHYDLETHWLGEDPSDAWVVRVDQLDTVTKAYLNTMGAA